MRYCPNEIVIGYYEARALGSTVRFGYPSCKWLKNGPYTEISTFCRVTRGLKPHMQRNPEKQISKDLEITIGTFENKLIDKFKIVQITSQHIVIVHDPRGFNVGMRLEWLNKALAIHHCSISSDGEISGKWVYVWDNKHFSALVHENEMSTIDVNDDIISEIEKNSTHFTIKNLVPGTIYDIYGNDNDKTKTERYVYLGQYSMYSLNATRNYLTSYQYQNHLKCFAISNISSPDDNRCPWINKKFISIFDALKKSFKKYPVFVKLRDNIQYNTGYIDPDVRLYCDTLANDASDEHSIRYALSNSNIEIDTRLVKRILSKSENQKIKVDEQYVPSARQSWCAAGMTQYYSNVDEYKTFSFKMLKDGFEKFLEIVNDAIEERMHVSPIDKPKDFPKWKNDVKSYYEKYHNEINYYESWLT